MLLWLQIIPRCVCSNLLWWLCRLLSVSCYHKQNCNAFPHPCLFAHVWACLFCKIVAVSTWFLNLIIRRPEETFYVFHFPKDKSGTFKLFTKGHAMLGFKVPYHWDILSEEWLGLHTSTTSQIEIYQGKTDSMTFGLYNSNCKNPCSCCYWAH